MDKSEFDEYIKNYRLNLNKSLSLSGETSDFFAQYKAKKLRSWFSNLANKPATILDYGCGDGSMANYVAKQFSHATVHGIDPSKLSIEYAAERYPSVQFTTMEQNKINYQSQTFDLIYAAGVFHHISFSEHNYFFYQIMHILKPGGHFVLFELNPYNPLTKLTFKRCPIDKNRIMLSPHYAKKFLSTAGTVKTTYYCFFPAFLKKLRCIEKYFTWLPIGALYACIVQKRASADRPTEGCSHEKI